jgi:hypothetical protein
MIKRLIKKTITFAEIKYRDMFNKTVHTVINAHLLKAKLAKADKNIEFEFQTL